MSHPEIDALVVPPPTPPPASVEDKAIFKLLNTTEWNDKVKREIERRLTPKQFVSKILGCLRASTPTYYKGEVIGHTPNHALQIKAWAMMAEYMRPTTQITPPSQDNRSINYNFNVAPDKLLNVITMLDELQTKLMPPAKSETASQ